MLNLTENAEKRLRETGLTQKDVLDVIRACEKEKQYALEEETGHRFCHRKTGYLTCWAEYIPEQGEAYRVYDVYTHRIEICEDN